MVKVIFKALVVIWPFLRSIIFKDRSVREVLRSNRQFTWLFIIMVFVMMVFGATIETLAGTQAILDDTVTKLKVIEGELTTVRKDYDALKTNTAGLEECTPDPYDKSFLLEMLE